MRLIFELTEACNQDCRFCYNHWRPNGCLPVDSRLARKTLVRLLNQAKIDSISFSGGEPFLLDNLLDLVLKCRFKGISVNILSNGTLISEDNLQSLKNIGINTLQIPLLSNDPAIHDYLTGVPGSWGKVCSSIVSSLAIIGPEHFAAVLIVTAQNCENIGDTLNLYKTLGIKFVMANRFNIGGNGLKNLNELCLSKEGLRKSFKTISDFAIKNPEIKFVSGVCTPICLLNPVEYPGIRFTSCSSNFNNRPVAISFKGDVRFCNHSPFVLGNIWNRNINNILNDETINAHYSSIPESCSRCELYSQCKGGCRAASEQVYGSFDIVDPIMELSSAD